MRADDYVELERFETVASAQALRSLLESEGIDCLIDPSDPLAVAVASGGRGIRLYVPRSQKHRAEYVLRDSQFSDEELTYLATGERSDATEE